MGATSSTASSRTYRLHRSGRAREGVAPGGKVHTCNNNDNTTPKSNTANQTPTSLVLKNGSLQSFSITRWHVFQQYVSCALHHIPTQGGQVKTLVPPFVLVCVRV